MPIITIAHGKTCTAEPGVSLLDAASAAGLALEYSCRTGRCGTCKTRLLSGSTTALRDETSLTAAEIAAGWILTCTRAATSDVTLDAEDLAALAGITTKTLPCRINALSRVSHDVLVVELRLPPNAGFAFLAGQYIDVTGPGGIKRSYSIASAACQSDKLELHIRHVDGGAMSAYWFDRAKVNDLLRFRGPLGTFFLRDPEGLDLVFLATGTGYAPVRSMLKHLQSLAPDTRPRSVALYWGGRIPSDLYADPRSETATLHYTPVLSRADGGWTGARGHVHDRLLDQPPALDNVAIYACGSDAMIHSARSALTAAGLAPKRFYADAFVSSN